MPILLILLVAAVVEVAVLVAVGDAIGVLPTIGLLLLASLVGAWLLRREGSRTLRAFSEAARTRRPPHRELADGVLIAAGGVLMVLPGFVSDVLGLVCLLPPTRALLRRRMLRSASRATPPRFAPGGVVDGGVVNRDADDGQVVDGEVVDPPVTGDARNVARRDTP
ncbi:MAG: FxsA family protein [Pseudonocardiaceae bacterium]|nr:FxsA family protein [Pseudonocardiaceae bacterium]